jgi:hypothetical protein
MARTGEGGGYGARVVTHTSNPKREVINHPVSQGAVSRLGAVVGQGTPFKPLYQSSKASTPIGATPSVAGPGGGRMVMRAGSQAPCKPARPLPRGETRVLKSTHRRH